MTKWTKADIDELVARVDRVPGSRDTLFDYRSTSHDGSFVSHLEVKSWDVARALYLAAGLTAEGERKPEKVSGWLVKWPYEERPRWYSVHPHKIDPMIPLNMISLGTFIPDGAE